MQYKRVLNAEGLKAGKVCVLNRKCALNNGVHLTTRVYDMYTHTHIHMYAHTYNKHKHIATYLHVHTYCSLENFC